MRRFLIGGLTLLALGGVQAGNARADLILTANAAGSQSSTVSGVTTETFNSFSTGEYSTLNTAVGTLSSPGLAIVGADQYGGAGGTGNYFAIGNESGQSSATLTLSGPQSYFGFWLSAADSANELVFLSGGQVVGTLNVASVLGAFASSYSGNPNNTSEDAGEKFAYLNVFGTSGTTINQVEFLNPGGTGLETDNWSIRSSPVTPTGSLMLGSIAAVPEPSSMLVMGSGMLAVIGFRRRLGWIRNRDGDDGQAL